VIRAYHLSRGDAHRTVCIVPESAHGTNPASAVMAGMQVVIVKSTESGDINMADLREKAAAHADKLAANAVTTEKIAGEAVITGKLANGSVTATKLANGSVRSAQLGTVTRRSVLLEVGAGATDFGSPACLAGERAISGGGAWVSGINAALAEKLHVVHSFPNSAATSWGTRVYNGSAGTENFNAYVLCLQAG